MLRRNSAVRDLGEPKVASLTVGMAHHARPPPLDASWNWGQPLPSYGRPTYSS